MNMNPSTNRDIVLAALALAFVAALVGCQEVDQPKTTLTQKQWQQVKQHIKEERPDPQYPIGANFGDKIEFIGFDVTKPLVAGQKATFTWYWKALDDIDDNWRVFVHFDSSEDRLRQNLDHHPLDGLYQTSRWKKGQIIEDVQEVTIRDDFPAGQAVPFVGFYKGPTRLPIENDVKKTDDRRVIGPAVTIKAGSAQKKKAEPLPEHYVPNFDEDKLADLDIDGKLDEEFWETVRPIELKAFGAAPDLKTKVKVFSDKEHLYIGAHLPDEHIWSEHEERDSALWNEEVLEVFIDPDRDGKDYLELQINPLGTIFDAHFAVRLGRGEGSRDDQIEQAKSWNMDGLESAVHVEGTVNDDSDKDQHWSVELKLPYAEIPGVDAPPSRGDSWAVNFYRYDRPDKRRTLAYAWSKPSGGSFHQVERFGTLKFAGPPSKQRRLNPEQIKKIRKNVNVQRIDPAKLKQQQLKGGANE
jgi:hypothetical protein